MSVKIYFQGEILDDFELDEVKQNLAKLFRKDIEQLAPLFSGKKIAIKECQSEGEAEKVCARLEKAGALVWMSPEPSADQPVTRADHQAEVDAQEELQEVAQQVVPQEKNVATAPRVTKDPEPARIEHKVSWKQVFKYRVDTFMAKGGSSSFKALTAAFLSIFFLIAGFRGLLHFLSPEAALQYESLDFFGNVYITFLQLTDPGNMAQDILSSPWYKLFAVFAGLAGVVLLSALIAFITTALDQKLNELKRGRSKVIEQDHTLILGWNEQRIVEIIRELILANESEDDGCIVILADMDKEAMDDILRLQIPDRKTSRIVTRSGRVSTLANLDMVSIEHCRSIVILGTCEDTAAAEEKIKSDAAVIQTVLAASSKAHNDEVNIVAEIFNDSYRDIIENSFSSRVVIVNTSDILAKLLVQTSRSVGLSVVYSEILSFDGCEMYFHGEDDWRSTRFGDLAYFFPDGVPMGVRNSSGELILNTDPDYVMNYGDEIIIVADDDSTIEFRSEKVVTPVGLELVNSTQEQQTEKELIIGWNHKAPIIISEFADYVMDGSVIDIMLQHPTDAERKEIKKLDEDIDNIKINLVELNPLNRDDLLSLDPFNYNNIIILAGAGDDLLAQQVDSANIVTLLLLRNIFEAYPEEAASTKLITEILESQNQPIVAQAGVKDIIISNQLVSMIIAQVSEDVDIKDVYDDIFQEDGSEIYLKPLSQYYQDFPLEVNFADLIDLAQQRNEICIGVKIKALENEVEENNGVELIPLKDKRFTLTGEDSLVVLAEDEL